MNKYALLAAAAVAALSISAAQASPFHFTYTGTIASASTPGVSAGDIFTLTVTADNGGTSLANQTWDYSSLQGLTIHTGSYIGTYSKAWESSGGFATDASGNLDFVSFFGTSDESNNSDNFGSWTGDYVYGDGSFVDFFGRYNQVAAGFYDPANWSVSAASGAVPEAASWALMLGGFGLVGGAMRLNRRGAAVAFG